MSDYNGYQTKVQLELNVLASLTGKKAFKVVDTPAAISFVWEQFKDEARIEDTVDCLAAVFISGSLCR